MKNRYSLLAAAAVLLSGCSGSEPGAGPTGPDASRPRFSHSGGNIISMVRGFTTASDGTIYQQTANYVLCFTDQILIANHPAINKETGCADSTSHELLDGGVVDISITVDQQVYYLGSVPGDLSRRDRFIDVPTNGTVTAEATPHGGCTFLRWQNTNHNGTVYNSYSPTLVQSAATVDREFFAFFECQV